MNKAVVVVTDAVRKASGDTDSAASKPPVVSSQVTVQRGHLVLHQESCTSCMLCVRECPAWCITLRAEQQPDPAPAVGGGRKERTRNVLVSFDVDYGLCMYCGICVDVCPPQCLSWRSEPTPTGSRTEVVHGIDELSSN